MSVQVGGERIPYRNCRRLSRCCKVLWVDRSDDENSEALRSDFMILPGAPKIRISRVWNFRHSAEKRRNVVACTSEAFDGKTSATLRVCKRPGYRVKAPDLCFNCTLIEETHIITPLRVFFSYVNGVLLNLYTHVALVVRIEVDAFHHKNGFLRQRRSPTI